MELYDYITILTLSVMVFGTFMIYMSRQNKGQKARKAGDEGVSTMYNVYNQQVEDVLKLKDNQIKRLNSRITQLEPVDQEESDNGVKPVTFEEITALVNTKYPKYAQLLPLVKKQVMDATKGMTMNEILSYVKQFTGNQQSQGETNPESITYNPNWA